MVSKIKPLFFLVLVLCAITESFAQDFQVIKPATKEELGDFYSFIVNSEEWKISMLASNSEFYIVDINNDGVSEYVAASVQGSGGYLSLIVFSNINGKFKELKIPGNDRPNGPMALPWHYRNPFTYQEELFVRAQNKIYFFMQTSCSGLVRDIFLWQNGKVIQACDKFWIAQQRKLFQQLYTNKFYQDAFSLLDKFEKDCRSIINPQTNLWIQNDLALASLRSGCPKTALSIIKRIKGAPGFSDASKQLKDAVKKNKELCEKELGDGNKRKYDYSWLLEYKDVSNNTVVCCDKAKRIEGLLAAAVPEILDPLSITASVLWKDEVKNCLAGPNSDVKVIDNRYVVFSGFRIHCASTKAFFWCDIKERVSAVAMSDGDVAITSTSLLSNELPVNFLDELSMWLKSENIGTSHVQFISSNGDAFDISLYFA